MIRLWGTGLGPGTIDNGPPARENLPIQTEVFVGEKQANVLYSGRSECCASVDVIEFEVPPEAPDGCWVPVYVRTAGVNVSNTVTMAIGSEPRWLRRAAESADRCADQGRHYRFVLRRSAFGEA